MKNRQIVTLVSIIVLLIAIGILINNRIIDTQTTITDSDIIKAPSGSFYFFKDGMPCLGLIFESDDGDDVDVSTTCDWSRWHFKSTNVPEPTRIP